MDISDTTRLLTSHKQESIESLTTQQNADLEKLCDGLSSNILYDLAPRLDASLLMGKSRWQISRYRIRELDPLEYEKTDISVINRSLEGLQLSHDGEVLSQVIKNELGDGFRQDRKELIKHIMATVVREIGEEAASWKQYGGRSHVEAVVSHETPKKKDYYRCCGLPRVRKSDLGPAWVHIRWRVKPKE